MSINRDMKTVMLQVDKGKRSSSGAHKEHWQNVRTIDVAIYKNSDMIMTASARYNESSHTGLTCCKEIQEGKNRLLDVDRVYLITGCNTKPRLTNLMLKVVESYAR